MSLAPPPAILPPTSAPRPAAPQIASPEPLFDVRIDQLFYGDALAVRDVRMSIPRGKVTALIGPSGCGKSTVLRCLNRMNDLIPGFRLEGEVRFLGQDIYSPDVDPVLVRRNVGMVFQQPNPFATSIYKNVAFGLKLNKYKGDRTVKVREALESAALWDEVKDKLNASGLSLSGGQQQRLCIARAIATDPPVLLMDEPCSALDPIATAKIEELIDELVQHYTIVMVTHNLAQAMRVSDYTGFFYVDTARGGRTGHLIEFGETDQVLNRPKHHLTRQYVEGAFG